MPALTKADRAALPDTAFAVPSRRMLPIHDAEHVRFAWGEVQHGNAKLTDEERAEARILIMQAAADHGVETAAMHKVKGLRLQAMSLALPDVEDHPNRHPFSGTLVRLDEPSDLAPHGSNGRKVKISRSAAENALDSLLGMGVGVTADLDGHDEKHKVGVITKAEIVDEAAGPAVYVEGFLYASDFPDEVSSIRASADDLGFSFEARDIWVADPRASVLEVTKLAFTGAAILFKDKAAYHNTSLSASADVEIPMTAEEMKAALEAAVAKALEPIQADLTAVKASAEALKVENTALLERVQASRVVLDKVEPFAAEAEALATKMKAAGIGSAARSGHADILERMASDMRAEAARGTIPSSFYAGMYAAGEAAPTGEKAPDLAAQIAAAVETAVAPMKAAAASEAEKAAGELAAARQEIKDLKAAGAEKKAPEAGAGERKTLPAFLMSALSAAGQTLPEGEGKLAVADVDAALKSLPMGQRLQAKAALSHAGLLAA